MSFLDKEISVALREELGHERQISQCVQREFDSLARSRANETLAQLLHEADLEVEVHVTVRPREKV